MAASKGEGAGFIALRTVFARVVRRAEVNCGISRVSRNGIQSLAIPSNLSDPPRPSCAVVPRETLLRHFRRAAFSTWARVDSSRSGIKTIAVETREDGEAWRIRLIVRLLSSSGFSWNDCDAGYTFFHLPEQTTANEKNYFRRIPLCKRAITCFQYHFSSTLYEFPSLIRLNFSTTCFHFFFSLSKIKYVLGKIYLFQRALLER